jgi:hypothetical protein
MGDAHSSVRYVAPHDRVKTAVIIPRSGGSQISESGIRPVPWVSGQVDPNNERFWIGLIFTAPKLGWLGRVAA